MKLNKQKNIFYVAIILIITASGFYYWGANSSSLPTGFAQSNGRIEATERDIATNTVGRIDTITVRESDFVKNGQVLAKMDTRSRQEQLHEIEAQLRQAISAVVTAESSLSQRQSEKLAA